VQAGPVSHLACNKGKGAPARRECLDSKKVVIAAEQERIVLKDGAHGGISVSVTCCEDCGLLEEFPVLRVAVVVAPVEVKEP
jgi:hypothetical protein